MKKRLMTPGPTQVPEAALLTLAKQVEHHRTKEFRQLFAQVVADLKDVFKTAGDVFILSSSGTGGMEAAVTNLVPRGGKAIVLESGKFSERWRKICDAFGIEVVKVTVPWGEPFRPEDVAEALKKHPDAAAVFSTLMESSTGVGHDIEAIGRVVAESPACFVVDGISGAAVMECRVDDWGVDALVVGSQKALMLPPGLAMITVSKKAWSKIDANKPQAFYFDLREYRKAMQPPSGPDTPWTSAHTLIAALAENLKLIKQQGIETVWERARVMGRATRAGIEALGLEIFPQRPAAGLTAVKMFDGIDADAFAKRLEQRFGIKVAGGQGHLKGKIIRIAHMGIVDELDILCTLSAIEMVLDEMGRQVEFGTSVAAATRVLVESKTAAAAS